MKTRWISLNIAVIPLIAGSFYPTVGQRSQERVIKRMPVEKNEPIEIIDIKVNGQSISFDKKFTADDDWLRTLVVLIKNKSDKCILFASIQLQFPRPAGSQDKMSVDDIFYGNWALQRRPLAREDRLIGIAPGETIAIPISAQKFLDLRQFLTETDFPQSIERLDLRVNRVIFEDDTMWTRGASARRDPSAPTIWKNVNP